MELENKKPFATQRWLPLRKRFRLIVLCTLMAALGAGVLSFWQDRLYRATTYLLLAESKLADVESKTTNFVYYELLRSYETLINNDYLVSKTIQKFELQKPPYELSVDSFRRRGVLQVELSKNTRLLEVTVEFPNARLAAEICNYFVNQAVAFNEELNSRDAEKARLFLKEQLDHAGQSMELAQKRLLEFNQSSTVEGLRESVRSLLAAKSGNETELAALQLELTRNAAKRESLAASSGTSGDPESAVQFRIVEMQSEIAGIKASVEALRKVLETNKQALARLEREKALKENTQQQLLDEYDLARENYDTLSKKYQDASINVGARSTDLKMITPAVVPERPFKPRIVLNIILAAGFGLLLSVGLSFLLHNLETPKVMREVEFPVEEKIVEVRRQGKGV
jgi:tyrosine-protein kinase Etk/Wzc